MSQSQIFPTPNIQMFPPYLTWLEELYLSFEVHFLCSSLCLFISFTFSPSSILLPFFHWFLLSFVTTWDQSACLPPFNKKLTISLASCHSNGNPIYSSWFIWADSFRMIKMVSSFSKTVWEGGGSFWFSFLYCLHQHGVVLMQSVLFIRQDDWFWYKFTCQQERFF